MTSRTMLVLVRQFDGVEDELLGGGVRVIHLPEGIREKIYEQNSFAVAKWDLFASGYDHAIVNVYEPARKSDEEAEQEIIRAIFALRIIQPSSVGLHLVISGQESPEGTIFSLQSRFGIHSMTYVCNRDINTFITRQDIRKARPLWPNIQEVCQRWQFHRRIMQAIRYYEIGCANYNGEIRHILFHSSLECLICTCRDYLGQQVRQRVMAICPGVTLADVKDIIDMRGGLVHSGAIVQVAKGREEELIQKLDRIVRACLYHALADRESVEIFSDVVRLKKAFPVEVDEAKRKETGRKILV